MPPPASTQRFSDRVANYVRYRPGYPEDALAALQQVTGINASSTVADIGSGTGISSEFLLRTGCTVHGIEPNREMREAAEQLLVHQPRFHSVEGTAEATGLPRHSVSHVCAAQAFHWFDPGKTRRESLRILQPGGWAILLWNARHLDTTPFLRAYEALLLEYGTDYREVRHENVSTEALQGFFGGGCTKRIIPNAQSFDLAGLKGRLLSSSYAPAAGHPGHLPMLAALDRIFAEHQEEGRVCFEYDTQIFAGRLT